MGLSQEFSLRTEKILSRYLRWAFLSALCGILAGVGAAIFLNSLSWATSIKNDHSSLIWGLPIGGFFIGWLYHYLGKDIAAGNNLILEQIHDPKKVLPFYMAPFILLASVVSHLFGASVGREGAIVQTGASLADQLSRLFPVEPEERKILLTAGAGAGFGAALGAPWAGVIFGMEVIHVGKLRLFAWFECLIASLVAYYTAVFLHAEHSTFSALVIPTFDFRTIYSVAIAGVFFGLAARVFSRCTHLVERVGNHWIHYSPLKPFFGGLLLAGLFYAEGTYRYVGLGVPVIQEALLRPSSFQEPILKLLFTALSVGSGFKGGEFVPLVFIGTTLGSALSMILPASFALLAALGFAATFAGAANTPIACTLMAMEIFGARIGPLAFIACFVSYYFSGHQGIYKAQKVQWKKHEKLFSRITRFGASVFLMFKKN